MTFGRRVCRSICEREEKALVTGATSSGDAKKATIVVDLKWGRIQYA